MPGPLSSPAARRLDGVLVAGKTAMKRQKLVSRDGLSKEDQLFGQRKYQEQIKQREDAKAAEQEN